MFRVNLEGERDLERAWRVVMSTVSAGVEQGVRLGIAEGLGEARQSHLYKDRTGALTASLSGGLVTATRGGAEGIIEAKKRYASFVENGTRPHEIRPKEGYGFVGPLRPRQSRRAKDDIGAHRAALRWYDDPVAMTGVHFARVVHHPGSRPYPFMALAYFRCEHVVLREIERAIVVAQQHL